MTKRTLYIIICLLLLLDAAAIFIYLVGNINRDGKSSLLSLRDKNVPVEKADTIPDRLSDDRFDTITRSASFVASNKVLVDDEQKRMTSTIKFKVVWPLSINGKRDLNTLENEIIETMMGHSYGSIEEAIDVTMANPHFASTAKDFTRVSDPMLTDSGSNHTKQLYRAFPYFRTNYLLEYVILVEKYDGHKMHRTMNIVHYDRLHHNIITLDKIFDLTKRDEILALVNQSIERLKTEKKNKQIHETSVMPTQFLLGTKSVIFYMPDGRIAPVGSGLYEVSVKNDALKPYFTNFYTELLNNDSHFDSLGFLVW